MADDADWKTPSGSHNDVVGYEVIGDGRVKPEFVAPEPITMAAYGLRQAILQDFEQLGNTLGIAQGQPQGQNAGW